VCHEFPLAVGTGLGEAIIALKCSAVIVGDDIIALLELFDADRMPKENIKSEKVTVVLPS